MQWQSAMVAQWPSVFVTVEQLERTASSLMPIAAPGSYRWWEAGHAEALWVTEVQGSIVGIAWQWGPASNDAVAMTDPMTVATNLVLTDGEGRMLDDAATIIELNNVIYELPWQRHVPPPSFERVREVESKAQSASMPSGSDNAPVRRIF